jgi:hypothetical protein
MSNYFLGNEKSDLKGDSPNYLYAFRRTDDGELYLAKINQLSRVDSITINNEGDPADNFTEFETGVDFFEGRDVYHNLTYENLNYEQYRWDDRNIYYYIDSSGNLVIRTDMKYQYPSGI